MRDHYTSADRSPKPRHSFSRRRFITRTLPVAGVGAAFLAVSGPQRVLAAITDSPTPTPTTYRLFGPQVACDSCAPPLSEKLAQMIIAGFAGQQVSGSDVIASDIQSLHLGGVVLYDYPSGPQSLPRNISSPSQLQALTGELQGLNPSKLIISTDQEGGQVARLNPSHGFPPTVSAKYLGDIDDPSLTYNYAAKMAESLASMGINLNFAPDVDLNVNPNNPVIGAVDRSFSADPDVVTRNAEAFIRANHDHGVLCTLKHFPGHGSSTADSHLGFVNVTDTWSRVELEPFANIVADGLADVIMTAHIFNANLDPDFPATLSYKTVTGILREELGYDGVVISDDMQMKAITDIYGQETAIGHAINAGIDILLFGNNVSDDPDVVAHVVDTMQQLVQNGTISEARIDQSYNRIQALKTRLAG
ncbi:MAG: glycoside hydrolase family 3 N-terminal domain-containing protein [Tepidiformaceae bacterium]